MNLNIRTYTSYGQRHSQPFVYINVCMYMYVWICRCVCVLTKYIGCLLLLLLGHGYVLIDYKTQSYKVDVTLYIASCARDCSIN